jgi:hypothetical protein
MKDDLFEANVLRGCSSWLSQGKFVFLIYLFQRLSLCSETPAVTRRLIYFLIQQTQQQARSIDIIGIAALRCKLHFLLISFKSSSCLPCNTTIRREPTASAPLRTAIVALKVRTFCQKSIKPPPSISWSHPEHGNGIWKVIVLLCWFKVHQLIWQMHGSTRGPYAEAKSGLAVTCRRWCCTGGAGYYPFHLIWLHQWTLDPTKA